MYVLLYFCLVDVSLFLISVPGVFWDVLCCLVRVGVDCVGLLLWCLGCCLLTIGFCVVGCGLHLFLLCVVVSCPFWCR